MWDDMCICSAWALLRPLLPIVSSSPFFDMRGITGFYSHFALYPETVAYPPNVRLSVVRELLRVGFERVPSKVGPFSKKEKRDRENTCGALERMGPWTRVQSTTEPAHETFRCHAGAEAALYSIRQCRPGGRSR